MAAYFVLDVQRDIGVVHPEAAIALVRELEQHAVVRPHRRAVHQAPGALGLVVGDLDLEGVGPRAGDDLEIFQRGDGARLGAGLLGRGAGGQHKQGRRKGSQDASAIVNTQG